MKLSAAFLKNWTAPWREYLSEFVGTTLFVFLASAVVLVGKIYGLESSLVIGFGVSFSYIATLYATTRVSWGFLNPAVVVALWLVGKLTAVKAVFYIFAQILGSFAAVSILFAVFGQRAGAFSFGVPVLGLGVSMEGAFILEAVLVSVFVFLVFALAVNKNDASVFAPLVLGLYLVVAGFISYPISGMSINPVRALGPGVISGNYLGFFVYLIGPFLGSLVGLFYEYVFVKKPKGQ